MAASVDDGAFMTVLLGAGTSPCHCRLPGILLEEFVDEVGSLHPVERPDSPAEHLDRHVLDLGLVRVVLADDFID